MKKELSEFKKFVSNYNLKDASIRFKYDHSIRVMRIANSIAKKLKLDNKEVYMITLAGLLHDIGRFDQIKEYNTFNDLKSFDHGDYAYDLIVRNKILRNYVEEDAYDSAILEAIKNHNKFKIGECNEKELFFSKIIRDADKIDILLNGGAKKFSEYETNDLTITDSVYNNIMNEEPVDYINTKNKLDRLLLGIAMIYDFNFKCSFDFVKGKGVVESIISFIKSKNTNKETLEKLILVEQKINNYIRRMAENGKEIQS